MTEKNNLKHVEEELEAPKRIQNKVESNLELGRFTGGLLDLYVGKIGAIVVNFFKAFSSQNEENKK